MPSKTPRRQAGRRIIRMHFAAALAYAGTLPCVRCGEPVRFGNPFDVDHITPLALGGTDHLVNLGVSHPMCNRRAHCQLGPASHTRPHIPSRVW